MPTIFFLQKIVLHSLKLDSFPFFLHRQLFFFLFKIYSPHNTFFYLILKRFQLLLCFTVNSMGNQSGFFFFITLDDWSEAFTVPFNHCYCGLNANGFPISCRLSSEKKRGARWDVCKVLYIRGKLMYFVLSRFYGHQSKQFGISMGFCCKCKFCYRKNWMLNRKEKKRNQHTNQRRKRDGQYDSHAMLKNTWCLRMMWHWQWICACLCVLDFAVLCCAMRYSATTIVSTDLWIGSILQWRILDWLNELHTIFRTQKENKMLIAHSRHSLHSMRYFFFLSHVVVGGVFLFRHFSLFYTIFAIRQAYLHIIFLYFLHIMNR